MDFPSNELFCPKLACDVYDYVYKGFSQPLIGTFTISIGDIMKEQREERSDNVEKSLRVIEYLKALIRDAGFDVMSYDSLRIQEQMKEESGLLQG